jgi:hypothetical protein
MVALTQDIKTQLMGAEDNALPVLLTYPVAATTSIFAGSIVALNASGLAVPASATLGLKVIGRCERQVLNLATGGTVSPDGIATGAAGSINVEVHQGAFYYFANPDSTFTAADFGANVYAADDNTISKSDLGGARPYAGYVIDGGGVMASPESKTKIGIMLAVPNPYATNPELLSATQFKARAVVTSLATYTGTGTNTLTASVNGAFGTQDGVAVGAGDTVFIQAGTTNLTAAVDSGPWVLTVPGTAGTKWVLTRPDWFTTGAVIPVGAIIDIGGEGTAYLGTAWKSFAAVGSAVIGTNDPTFYVRSFTQAVTLVTGFVKLGSSQTFPGLRSITTSDVTFIPTNFNGAGSTASYRTGAYASGGSATAAGYMGTSTVSITALVAAGTFNASDVGTGLLNITNW